MQRWLLRRLVAESREGGRVTLGMRNPQNLFLYLLDVHFLWSFLEGVSRACGFSRGCGVKSLRLLNELSPPLKKIYWAGQLISLKELLPPLGCSQPFNLSPFGFCFYLCSKWSLWVLSLNQSISLEVFFFLSFQYSLRNAAHLLRWSQGRVGEGKTAFQHEGLRPPLRHIRW